MTQKKTIFIILLATYFITTTGIKNKAVNIMLKTNWPAYPFFAEASEFFSSLSSEDFWNFFQSFGVLREGISEKEIYEKIIETSNFLVSETKVSLLKWALSMHNFNPVLEMYSHILVQDLNLISDSKKVLECPAFVLSKGIVTCDLTENILQKIISETNGEMTEIYDFDHVYQNSAARSTVVVLYGLFGAKTTFEFHQILKKFAEQGKITYVFRHYFPNHEELPRLNLQGFGVDLALKSLEYKVIDDSKHEGDSGSHEIENTEDELPIQGFNFQLLAKNFPEFSSELLAFKAQLLSEELDLEKMKAWELKNLGIEATQKILLAPNPINMLRDIAQNLPMLAHSLARQATNKTLENSIFATVNSLNMEQNILWINDLPLEASSVDPFSIYELLFQQVINYDILKALHISGADIFKILTLPNPEVMPIQLNIDTDLTDFFNDLENDKRHLNWGKSVRDILRPVWPGQLHYIAKNMWTLICIIDPASVSSLKIMDKLGMLLKQHLPVRVGVLFDVVDESSVLGVKIWKYIRQNQGTSKISPFISDVLALHPSERVSEEDWINAGQKKDIDVNKIKDMEDWDEFLEKSKNYLKERGLVGTSPSFFLNGYLLNTADQDFTDVLLSKCFDTRLQLQKLVQSGQLKDDSNIHQVVLDNKNCLQTINKLILEFPGGEKPKFAPIYKEDANEVLDQLRYVVGVDAEDLIQPITHLLAVDLLSEEGRNLSIEAVKRISKEGCLEVRVGFINQGNGDILFKAISAVLETNSKPQVYLPTIIKLLEIPRNQIKIDSISSVIEKSDINHSEWKKIYNSDKWQAVLSSHSKFCNKILGIKSEDNAVVTNSRVITLPESTYFTIQDFELLEKYEMSSRIEIVQNIISEISYDIDPDLVTSSFISNVIQKVVSILQCHPDRPTSQVKSPKVEPSISVKTSESPTIEIVAVLDPLSPAAQRTAPILVTIVQLLPVDLKIILNPSKSLSSMPLQNFFRYVSEPLTFDENGKLLPGGIASFANLPQARLLSTTMATPSSWLVSSYKCKYDLDNIILQDLPASETALYAEFRLEHILIEGSCSDERGPPRGLELILGDKINPHQKDSLVMSNLGYFQLKGNPGVWNLDLAPGKASTIYQIKNENIHKIVLKDFNGKKEMLRVQKRPGMEHMSLFDEETEMKDTEQDSIWETFTGLFGGAEEKETDKVTVKDDETIHVFSLASGHLYERFLKIMMLSVIKNTKSPVKFWLLSNFLSPAFKEFVPKLAEKYNFLVELVTYKWPAWLNEQTVKQRIIWGYKILFLDVLFPLNLKKVIYVDSDQVIRVDLKELHDLNLRGRPYGYTPFCSGENLNKNTTGFRFWDSGYWRDHLQGKKYHISALYVVDLETFRERGYGDQLRATYNGLSQDPNSLSNLDQDLPNYLQHIVPIYSLPQEWLWCETWCTMESKDKAKTIDLCNNPLTKTPKLEAAVKLIPEWSVYDEEIKQFEHETISQTQQTDEIRKPEL